jgi:hypothetical protein
VNGIIRSTSKYVKEINGLMSLKEKRPAEAEREARLQRNAQPK